MFSKSGLFALATVATVAAQSAIVTIEASHGGAGSDVTNTTITVPLNTRYTNSALQTVSSLYLTGAEGVDLSSITCTPYTYNNQTGPAPFTSSKPSLLSTNTVQVGSLLCVSNDSSSTTSSSYSTTSTGVSTTSTGVVTSVVPITSSTSALTTLPLPSPGNATLVPIGHPPTTPKQSTATSILLTTLTPSSGSSASPSTITSTDVLSASSTPAQSSSAGMETSSTSSASASLNSDSAGTRLLAGNGLVVAGLGLMAIL